MSMSPLIGRLSSETPTDLQTAPGRVPIPAELARLVLACLAKEPADRPQSAPELNAALAAIHGATR